MVGINEKAIRIVAFSGKSKDYRMWVARLMAGAHVKKYQQCLVEDFSKREIVKRKMLAEPKLEGETEVEAKKRIQKDIEEGLTEEEVEMVVRAYADLMLACSEEISFGIVFNSKSTIFPEGDAYLAWQQLKRKYEPSTNAQKIMRRRELHQSRLTSTTKSPDDWIEELEIIRAWLEALGVIIEDNDLVLQVLEGLPKEYDMIVALLNTRYKINDLDVWGTEDTGACCCSRSQNFYNILCCRKSDDQAGHETDNDGNQVKIYVGEHENNQEADIEVDAEDPEELNLGAWDLVASPVEDAFYYMAFGDDEYEVSSDEEEHLGHDGKTVGNVVAEIMSEPSDNSRDNSVELSEEQREREQRLRIALANEGMREPEIERYIIQVSWSRDRS